MFSSNKSKLDEEVAKAVNEDASFFLPGHDKKSLEKVDAKPIERINRVQLQRIEPIDEEQLAKQDEEKLPLAVRERRQTVKVYDLFVEKAKWGEFYKIYGLVLMILGGFFLTVPFYNVVC